MKSCHNNPSGALWNIQISNQYFQISHECLQSDLSNVSVWNVKVVAPIFSSY